jgi:glycosyltransferase involved in cell wall biosynthesis
MRRSGGDLAEAGHGTVSRSQATQFRMTNPLVSIAIPAYNAAVHIRATLQSVQAQTYRNFEAIVVDDGSTDATSTIVEAFIAADPRFRLIRQRNAGVGGARNSAIRAARGVYIAPLDADDIWEPEKLEKQVECMERGGPEVGMVYCWNRRIDERGRYIGDGSPYTVEGRIRRALILRNLFGGASVPLFRASALADVGLYLTRADQHGGEGCEDWDLNLRVAERYLVRVAPEFLVLYRQRRDAISVNTTRMSTSYRAVLARAQQRSPDVPRALFRWGTGQFYFYLANKSDQWGFHSRSLRMTILASLSDPVLLLSRRVHRLAAASLLHLVTGGRFRRIAIGSGTARPQPLTAKHGAPDLVERIQRRRFELACNGPESHTLPGFEAVHD